MEKENFGETSDKKEKKKGKRICAWCKKEMGEWDGEGDTHGICSECYKKKMDEINQIEKGEK